MKYLILEDKYITRVHIFSNRDSHAEMVNKLFYGTIISAGLVHLYLSGPDRRETELSVISGSEALNIESNTERDTMDKSILIKHFADYQHA